MMHPETRTFFVIPTHDQITVILRCLSNLYATGAANCSTIVVVDDGSTDGSGTELTRRFPEITVLKGDGSLWWSGSIRKGMEYACSRGARNIIWLNNDCYPRLHTIDQLLAYAQKHDSIAVAHTITPSGLHYGGHRKTMWGFRLIACQEGQILPCDTFGGNCVCIPANVVQKIGYTDDTSFPHQLADADYGLRARRRGIPCAVLGSAICDNDDNLALEGESWLLSEVPLTIIWKTFFSMRSLYHIPSRFRFCLRHWSLWGLIVFPLPYFRFLAAAALRMLLPYRLRLRLFGHLSLAWKKTCYYRHISPARD